MSLLHSLFLSFILGLLVMPFLQSTPAKFRGVIVDANEGRIPEVPVLVENGKNKWNLRSNEDGEFSLNLPAGVYKFIFDPPRGFKKLIVSDFRVKADAKVNYKFEMEVGECSDCELVIEEPKPTPSATPPNS